MADNSMTDEKWNQLDENLDVWYEANPEHISRKPLTDGLIELGNNDPDNRKYHAQAISAVFKDLGVTRRSLARKPSIEDDAGFTDYLDALYQEAIAIYQSYKSFMATTLIHPKSGGGLYATAEDYAEYIVKTARYRLRRAFKANAEKREGEALYWDGSFDENGDPIVSTGL